MTEPSDLSLELPTRRSTTRLARRLAKVLRAGDLVVLDGPLGSGKTFLVRAMCRELGLPARVPVTSPTFTLVNEFATRLPVAHADLHRLEDAGAVRDLGLDALRDEGRVLLVEWGAPFVETLGGDALLVRLSPEPRSAHLTALGARSRAMLQDMGGPRR